MFDKGVDYATNSQQHVYTEMSGLNKMRLQAQQKNPESIRAVAEQFESMFLSMMMKSMREANEVFSEGNLLDNNNSKMYQGMLDQQLSLTLASGKGIGLADRLEEQLSGQVAFDQKASPTFPSVKGSEVKSMKANDNLLNILRPSSNKESLIDKGAGVGKEQSTLDKILAFKSTIKKDVIKYVEDLTNQDLPKKFANAKEFIDSLAPIANDIAKKFGLDGKMLLAQAALETGWGKHIPQQSDKGFNVFNIKANTRWTGDKINVNTLEFKQGVMQPQRDNFRAYDNYQQAFEDYGDFIFSNARYQKALSVKDDGVAYINALQNAGYATDPNYAKKITDIYQRDSFSKSFDAALTSKSSADSQG